MSSEESKYAFAIISQPIGLFQITHRHSFGAIIEYMPDGRINIDPIEYEGAIYYNKVEYRLSRGTEENIKDAASRARNLVWKKEYLIKQQAELITIQDDDTLGPEYLKSTQDYIQSLETTIFFLERIESLHEAIESTHPENLAALMQELADTEQQYRENETYKDMRYEGDRMMIMPCTAQQAQHMKDALDNIWIDGQSMPPQTTPSMLDNENKYKYMMGTSQAYYYGASNTLDRTQEIDGQ